LAHQLKAYDIKLIGCGGSKASPAQMKAIAGEVGVGIKYTPRAVKYQVEMVGKDTSTATMRLVRFPGFAEAPANP
jgi:hypothetical protein